MVLNKYFEMKKVVQKLYDLRAVPDVNYILILQRKVLYVDAREYYSGDMWLAYTSRNLFSRYMRKMFIS